MTAFDDMRDGQRRAHPRALLIGNRQGVDALVGAMDDVAQARLDTAIATWQPSAEDP